MCEASKLLRMSIQDWEPGQQSCVEKSLEKTESVINTTQGGYKGELITGLSQKLGLETQGHKPWQQTLIHTRFKAKSPEN